jgi:Ca2+/H+ antiporter
LFARIAYGATVALTVAVVVAELLHVPTLLIFAATALALIGLAWVLGQATESLGHNNHLRTLRRTYDRGEGFDHRFDHR